VPVGTGVLVSAGASAVHAARIWATAMSTAPGGAVGDSAQATRMKAKMIQTYFFLMDSPFPAPLGGMVKAHRYLINIADSEVEFKRELLAFL
jgi:C4-dicarboxylate transporter